MTAVLPPGYLDRFVERLLEDAVREATAAYWRRRAAAFQWARARPGDWPGRATEEERLARDARLAEVVEACQNAARLAPLGGDDD